MINIQSFETFVNESKINETLYEASAARRAWNGKLENVDNLMSWMYDKGILSKGDQAQKDRVFRQYYRFYNDGDFPRALSALNITKWHDKSTIEGALEQYLEGFIKKILAKYTGKYDRTDFRIDTLLGDLHTLKGVIDGHDAYGLLTHWGKKINIKDSSFEELMGVLKGEYDSIDNAVNAKLASSEDLFKDMSSWDRPKASHTLSWRKSEMERLKIWDSNLDKTYDKMTATMVKMSEIVQTVIDATNKLKQEIGN